MWSSSIPWSPDVEPARWVTGLLGSSLSSISWVVPLVYPAYARLEDPGISHGATHVARRVIDLLRRLEATECGRGNEGEPGSPAAGGSLDACWFAVADLYGWNGHDPLPDTSLVRMSDEDTAALRSDPGAFFESRICFTDARTTAAPRREPYPHRMAETGNRSYMLFPGPLEHALSLPGADAPTEIPDLWWPADHAWFLGCDTDFPHLFLGGTRTLIDQVLADPDLHATEIEPGPTQR